MSIVWLASYPKSGNTWLRAVLTCYLQGAGDSLSINTLIGSVATQRDMFDELVGLPSSDMTPGEILRLRPLLHELLAAESPHPTFVKVHDACIRTAAGPLFPRTATAGAVYLVRNPLDVAVSFAHHQQWSIDRTVAEMNRPAATGARRPRRIHGHVPEQRLSWSRNVSSWLESGLPLHVPALRGRARGSRESLRRRRPLRRPGVGPRAPRPGRRQRPLRPAAGPGDAHGIPGTAADGAVLLSVREGRRLAYPPRAATGARARRGARARHGTLRLSARGRGVPRGGNG